MIEHSDLFDLHQWTFAADLEAVRQALSRAFERAPVQWEIHQEGTPGPGMILFHCGYKGMPKASKRCTVLAGRLGDGQVQVYAKFWDYQLGRKIGLSFSGITKDSFVPIHRDYFNRSEWSAVDQRRTELAEGFRRTVETELR